MVYQDSDSLIYNHFTQVLWKGSTTIACARANSGNNVTIACDFWPPGNSIATRDALNENVYDITVKTEDPRAYSQMINCFKNVASWPSPPQNRRLNIPIPIVTQKPQPFKSNHNENSNTNSNLNSDLDTFDVTIEGQIF